MLDLTEVFFLKRGVKLINGYVNTSLYDIKNGRFYLISKNNGKLLSYFETQNLINDLLKKRLIQLGIGTYNLIEAEIQPLQFNYDSFNDCYSGKQCRLLYIEITDSCDFHCIHCYAEIERNGLHMMKIEEFKKVISSVSDDTNCDIRLTGGEPFLNPYICDFVSIVKNRIKPNNHHSIVTNGTFDIKDAIYALENGFELQISIYGCDYETFHTFTGASRELWDRVEHNLLELSRSKFRNAVLLCYAVNKLTYSELDNFVTMAKRRGFRYILNRPASTGRAVKNWDMLQLSIKDHYDFSKNTKANRMRFCFHLCQLHLTVVCVNGDVIPCSFLRKAKFVFGNVFEQSFKSIWNSQKYMEFRALTPTKVDKCKDCEFMYACSAGCCGEAEGFNNDILSCYPWCQIKPYENTYLDIKDNEVYYVDKLAAGTFDFELQI